MFKNRAVICMFNFRTLFSANNLILYIKHISYYTKYILYYTKYISNFTMSPHKLEHFWTIFVCLPPPPRLKLWTLDHDP